MKKLKQLFAIYATPQKVNRTGDFAPGQTLRLKFRNTPLRKVLGYLSKSVGLMIDVQPNVAVDERVDAFSDQPLSHDEALNLLEKILHEQGCTLIQNGRTLAIMRTEDAKKSYIPIRLTRNHAAIHKELASSIRLFTPAASTWSN